MQPSTLFKKDVRAYQIYSLHYGRCMQCNRSLSEGEMEYSGYLSDGTMAVACDNCKASIVRYIKSFVFHPKDFSIPNKETKLWRYQDFPKFMSLLDSEELFFTRADRFEDSFEGARGFNFQKDDIYNAWKPMITLEVRNRMQKNGNTAQERRDGYLFHRKTKSVIINS